MRLLTALLAAAACAPALADTRPDAHAPISVMGDHFHHQRELMLSYRFMRMSMQGNRDGTSGVSPDEVATNAPNPFAGMPMQPATLRVVPTKMTMDMHMVGLMYAPSDRVTLMGMATYLDKEMEHITYAGPTGTNRLGTFTTRSDGFGDTSISALIKLADDGARRWHATIGLSLPTGDIDRTGSVLTPMNTRPTVTLPYPMQLGSGTYDLIGGLTYAGFASAWGWGAQWGSLVRIGKNHEDYALGDEHELQGWLSYLVNRSVSISGRVGYLYRGNTDGQDARIMAPVQTADPHRQGLERVDLGLGANFLVPGDRHRLALEVTIPVHEDLNGPQLETDWMVTLGWQFTPR